MDVTALLIAVLTLVAGLALGLVLGRSRADAAGRQAVAAAESAGRHATAAAEAAGRDALVQSHGELARLQVELAGLRATLEAERAADTARDRSEADTEARLREAFGSLAGDALQRNNEAFAQLAAAKLATAQQGADGDLAQRQIAIEALVSPLRDSLERVQQQIASVERDRVGSYEKLLEQVGTMRHTSEQLRGETAQLVSALRAPQVRGQWGEMQLRRTVEAAGMSEHIDFVEQASVDTADGRLRPDMVVRLAGGKNVVVDSKVAFSGFLEATQATDPAVKAERLKAHARHLRTHIDQLAAKSYWQHFSPAPEFVVCFVPAEAFLDAALQQDPSLQERAFERNVVLATPSTLVALLRTVAYSWRQEALAANAAEVHKLGRELYQRLAKLGEHFDKLGRGLNGAVRSYNEAVGSLEGRVFVTARRMVELKVVDPTQQLASPEPLLETTRTVQAQEVVDQRLVPIKGSRSGAGQVPAGQGDLLTTDTADSRRASS